MNNDLNGKTKQPETIKSVKASLKTTDSGAVKSTIENCKTALEKDPNLRESIKFNVLTERVDIVKPLWWKRLSPALNETDLNYIMLYLEQNYALTNEKNIYRAISIVADEHKYHPICDYLSSLKWDGKARIRHALTRFLGADECDYTYECLRLFMLGAIKRVFNPGCKFELMLCLVGGQGAGKSSFFRLLAIKDDWFSDDLKRLDDENIYRKLQGHWIIEMSEMIATAGAKSIEEIKSFLSRQKEVYKVPYETQPADRLRQCVFGGTSNTTDFLPLDRSGNRRFLPVAVNPEKAQTHILADEEASREYITKMWAEAMEIYKSGDFVLKLSPQMERFLKIHQREFMPEDTKVGVIQAYLDKLQATQVCTKQIYVEALNHPYDEPKQWEVREINDIMNNSIVGWNPFHSPRTFERYGRQRGWERIESGNNCNNGLTSTNQILLEDFVEHPCPNDFEF